MPRSADLGPSQAGHLEAAAIVFVVLAMLLFIWLIWLAIRGSAEWISSLQSKTPPQQQTPAEQQPPPQQQTPSQQQTEPQQSHRPLPQRRRRPHLFDGLGVGECPPLGHVAYYSPQPRDRPRRQ